jgi:16S rRNA (cytosine967-C5)-methyltransferase
VKFYQIKVKQAAEIVKLYQHQEPFANFLNNHFRKNKKFGSKDRKWIREACYAYYRWGNAISTFSIEEKIKIGLWLKGLWDEDLPISIQDGVSMDFESRIKALGNILKPEDLFPCTKDVSENIRSEEFVLNHLKTPEVFFRITGKGKNYWKDKIPEIFVHIKEDCYSVPPETLLNEYTNQGYIQIQDIASQSVCRKIDLNNMNYVWDACAGSGGKTINLAEKYPEVNFFVSDSRKSILSNLKERTELILSKNFSEAVVDLSKPTKWLEFKKHNEQHYFQADEPIFDAIILDVPCSGSGVWRRNPENLLLFNCKQVDDFIELQKRIFKNALPYLKKDGVVYYITCSVFQKENEIHKVFWEKCGLKVEHIEYLNYTFDGGDCLFVSKLRKV